MNLKRIFGSILTLLGVVGLIYTAVYFVNSKSAMADAKELIVYGALGFVFFVSGIGLIRLTRDEPE